MFHLLLFAIVFTCCMPKEAKAGGDPQTWADNDNYFFSYVNVQEGYIHIGVKLNDKTGSGAQLEGVGLAVSYDGINYNEIYKFDKKDPGYFSVNYVPLNGFISAPSTYADANNSNQTWFEIHILITDISKIIKVKLYEDNNGNNDGWEINSDGDDPFPVYGTRDITIPQMSPIDLAPVSFFTTGNTPKALVGYKKNTLNDIDKVSKMELVQSNNNILKLLHDSVVSSLYDTLDMQGYANSYYYQQQAYFDKLDTYPNGRVHMNSSNIDVPAFRLPASFSANDVFNDTVKLVWNIKPVSAGYKYIANDFKLQIADNPSFTDPIEKTITYNSTDSEFYYNITQDFSPHMYFRVSRDYDNANWKLWDVSANTDLIIPFKQLDASGTSVYLQADNTAKITWYPDSAAWLPGSSFIVTKFNYTTSTQTEIKLSEADFKAGNYIDKQVSTCTEYHYALQVIPPADSKFATLLAVTVNGSILRSDIGNLVSIAASKGYYPDRTELRWNSSGAFDNFIVERAPYGTESYLQIATVTASGSNNYEADDEKGIPGTYYSYSIIGMLNCNNAPVYSKDTLYAIGFRSPTGNIYGRVRYDNGQAVTGVTVRLESQDATQLGKSIYLNGNTDSYLSVDSLVTPLADIATIEAWIKPDDAQPANQVIISRNGQYELGFDGNGKLYFNANGAIISATYQNTNQSYIHIAGIRSTDSVKIMVNDSVIAALQAIVTSSSPGKNVLIGKNANGNNFKGFIDELRIWNKALPDPIISRNYTRLLTGDEDKLTAYWRFDEIISNQFYDLAHSETGYNQNDGIIYPGASHTDTIPTPEQLSLKDYTDTSGNYFISGIPYTGNGTTYAIVPLLGTHQFDPSSVNRLVSPATTEFTVDFTDKSSFPVSGYVYYKNSTVPVKGVQFKIDGLYAQEGNGNIIETDATGNFSINVPVGYHEVKAVKANHVFINDGKLTDRYGNNINYQDIH